MGNSTITISLGDIKERRKVTGSVAPGLQDIVSVTPSCPKCLKASFKNGRIHYTYKAGEVKKALRLYPGYSLAEVKIFLVDKDGNAQTIKLLAKIVV